MNLPKTIKNRTGLYNEKESGLETGTDINQSLFLKLK